MLAIRPARGRKLLQVEGAKVNWVTTFSLIHAAFKPKFNPDYNHEDRFQTLPSLSVYGTTLENVLPRRVRFSELRRASKEK